MNSRRQFIFDCSAFVAVFAVAPLSPLNRPVNSVGSFRSLEEMSYPMLADQLNTTFEVRVSALQVVKLKLLKAPLAQSTPIRPGRRLPGDDGHEKFSLIFSGPADQVLPSAIHRFEHEALGRFEMFISQIGRPLADDVRYEAGFNRPVPATEL